MGSSQHKVSAIQELESRRGDRLGVLLSKREGGLVEDDMARDDDLVSGKVKAAIAFVMSRVTQKDAQG